MEKATLALFYLLCSAAAKTWWPGSMPSTVDNKVLGLITTGSSEQVKHHQANAEGHLFAPRATNV